MDHITSLLVFEQKIGCLSALFHLIPSLRNNWILAVLKIKFISKEPGSASWKIPKESAPALHPHPSGPQCWALWVCILLPKASDCFKGHCSFEGNRCLLKIMSFVTSEAYCVHHRSLKGVTLPTLIHHRSLSECGVSAILPTTNTSGNWWVQSGKWKILEAAKWQ